jgi:AhpD family alkylhydroperoxidase
LLVAIAGAVSLNCKPCLETLVPTALRHGIVPEEIAEVVSIVTEVRESVSTFTCDLIAKLLGWETMEKSKQACCGLDDECLTEPVGSAGTE